MPSGLTLYLDGIATTTPFVYDTLIGFNHTIEARNQSLGGTAYAFGSWSDGGAQTHNITVPSSDQSYTATYRVAAPPTPSFVQVNSATPQTAAEHGGDGVHQGAGGRRPERRGHRVERLDGERHRRSPTAPATPTSSPRPITAAAA